MKIPQWKNKNIRTFYILTVFNNCCFIAGNWIFFWTMFMSYEQLGMVDSIAIAFGMFMEIPTGALADLLGKKKTIISAFVFSTVGIFIMSAGISLTNILIGFLFAQLGWAIYSGSAEALAYDTLVDNKKEKEFDNVISFTNSVAIITAALSTLAGILFFKVAPNFPHVVWGFCNLAALVISLQLKEPKLDTEKFTWKTYLRQLSNGVRHMFSRKLLVYSVFFFLIVGVVLMYDWGLIKPAIAVQNGLMSDGQGIVFAVAGILSGLSALAVPFLKKKLSDFKGLLLLGLILVLVWVAFGFKLNFWVSIPMFTISIIGGIAYPWISASINKRIPSKDRATSISTIALVGKLPYVLVALIAGKMIENNELSLFCFGLAVIIFAGLVVNLFLNTFIQEKQTN